MTEEPVTEPLEPVSSTTTEEQPAVDTTPTSPPPPAPPARTGVLVPRWLLLGVGGVLVLMLGFGAGVAVGRNTDRDHREVSFDVRGLRPFIGGNGNSPFGPGRPNGNGNGPTTPGSPTVYLGVAVQNSSDPAGAEVARVAASSPAARAGLRSGDVITALDDAAIRNAAQLTAVVHRHHSGDEVTVKYTRDGAKKTVVVHLGSRSDLEQQ